MKTATVSVCARLTLDLHNLNNEGTEGNQQQTRMVHVVTPDKRRQIVNAVSGDMFKHILVGHLTPLLVEAGQTVCAAAQQLNPDRLTVDAKFLESVKGEKSGSAVLGKMLTQCSVTDMAGALFTGNKSSVARKSCVEFGWVVGLPDATVSENYFHVKYAPETREESTGGDTVAGKQAIFHRPANSGVYGLIVHLELNRIGVNDITHEAEISAADRTARAKCLLQALVATLVKPAGAQRNTQNPHILGCAGVIATASGAIPAPTVSPLVDDYVEQMTGLRDALNRIPGGAVEVKGFGNLAEAASAILDVAEDL